MSRWGCPTGDASDLLEAFVHSPDRSRHFDELVLIPLYADQDGYGIESSFTWRPRSDSYVRAADIRLRH